MKNYINLGLPVRLDESLRVICHNTGQTLTHFIKSAVETRVREIEEGRKYCSNGSPCTLNFMPDPRNYALPPGTEKRGG